MVRRLLVNSTPYETRAALLEDGVVVELFIERRRERGVVGNVYMGRVRKVLPGMQSAFVDIGFEKDSFLYVSDVAGDRGPEVEAELGEAEAAEALPSIAELLHEGDTLPVQVLKEPIGGKGARVTTHLSLPGRYLVLMPGSRHAGVSRRIVEPEERARLKAILEELREGHGAGFIARTASEGRLAEDFRQDAGELVQAWRRMRELSGKARPADLLHEEPGLLDRLLRDVVAGDFAEVVVDAEPVYQRAVEFLGRIDPRLPAEVVLHVDPTPMFEAYGIEAEIGKALGTRVWLPSGGYLVINQTEALVAIDVNTGRYVGKLRLEDTVLRTNLEAVREIVRQIRLRDLGGIIVLDLIDMDDPEHRRQVLEALEVELRRDRTKTKILQISDFGLVEMTRKRVRPSLERLLCRPCPECGGTGRVKSAETVCYEIERELRQAHRSLPPGVIELVVHPAVAALLVDGEAALLPAFERDLGIKGTVRGDAARRVDDYDLEVP
jgi:ribonuclease G